MIKYSKMVICRMGNSQFERHKSLSVVSAFIFLPQKSNPNIVRFLGLTGIWLELDWKANRTAADPEIGVDLELEDTRELAEEELIAVPLVVTVLHPCAAVDLLRVGGIPQLGLYIAA